MATVKHEWICDDCGHVVAFRIPELPDYDYDSEVNQDKTCCRCGEEMYFGDVFIPPVKTLNVPPLQIWDDDFEDLTDEGIGF